MSLPTRIMRTVQREALRQGATVIQASAGLRIRGRNGQVIIVHRSPSRVEVYRKSLPKELVRACVFAPAGGWKF